MVSSGKKLPRSVRIPLWTLFILGFAYAVYSLTLMRAAPELVKAKARIKTQRSEIRSLTSRLESAKLQQKVAEQEAGVIRRANQMMREEERSRQEELNRLQSELEFYQRLAGTSGTQSGLAVYHLELNRTGSEQVFRFVLTLTQNLRRSAIITGSVDMKLEGTQDDRPVSLPWSKISSPDQKRPEFRFKYFQQIEGYIAVPDDFQPSQLLVTLQAKGQNKPVSRSFDWTQLTAGEEVSGEPEPATASEEPLESELPDGSGEAKEND